MNRIDSSLNRFWCVVNYIERIFPCDKRTFLNGFISKCWMNARLSLYSHRLVWTHRERSYILITWFTPVSFTLFLTTADGSHWWQRCWIDVPHRSNPDTPKKYDNMNYIFRIKLIFLRYYTSLLCWTSSTLGYLRAFCHWVSRKGRPFSF